MDPGRNRFSGDLKYPSVVLQGKQSVGEFISCFTTLPASRHRSKCFILVASSCIISKGIAVGFFNTYRESTGKMTAKHAHHYTQ